MIRVATVAEMTLRELSRRRRVLLLLLLLPVGTLLSRLYLGAHHLTDALTSVVYASVWLLVVARVLLPGGRESARPSM
jgi:undecaprenyl-diphosphatase